MTKKQRFFTWSQDGNAYRVKTDEFNLVIVHAHVEQLFGKEWKDTGILYKCFNVRLN